MAKRHVFEQFNISILKYLPKLDQAMAFYVLRKRICGKSTTPELNSEPVNSYKISKA
ncbi:MAG: hypothetical protein JSV50_12845 [Desulfobacteraceae bacterium]|nr:MAG: hypothetical protein JSV50_12845 [Desulfobacteraceae bacterium]